MSSAIKDVNPYTFPAGPELDELIHRKLFASNGVGSIPPYSTSDVESAKLRSKLKAHYGHPIVVGQTRMPKRPFFARYESDPSTATEVIAETEPLAISRLALILIRRP